MLFSLDVRVGSLASVVVLGTWLSSCAEPADRSYTAEAAEYASPTRVGYWSDPPQYGATIFLSETDADVGWFAASNGYPYLEELFALELAPARPVDLRYHTAVRTSLEPHYESYMEGSLVGSAFYFRQSRGDEPPLEAVAARPLTDLSGDADSKMACELPLGVRASRGIVATAQGDVFAMTADGAIYSCVRTGESQDATLSAVKVAEVQRPGDCKGARELEHRIVPTSTGVLIATGCATPLPWDYVPPTPEVAALVAPYRMTRLTFVSTAPRPGVFETSIVDVGVRFSTVVAVDSQVFGVEATSGRVFVVNPPAITAGSPAPLEARARLWLDRSVNGAVIDTLSSSGEDLCWVERSRDRSTISVFCSPLTRAAPTKIAAHVKEDHPDAQSIRLDSFHAASHALAWTVVFGHEGSDSYREVYVSRKDHGRNDPCD